MKTYLIRTRAPAGKRGGRGACEAFIIVAADHVTAQDKARSAAYAGATVIEVTEVTSVQRVCVS